MSAKGGAAPAPASQRLGVTWNEQPLVVTVAPCGAEVTRDDNPAVPYTPEEIVDSCVEAAAAGSTVAHLHVREADGTPSCRLELWEEVIRGIRSKSQLITMASTGGTETMPASQRLHGIEAAPDLVGVESGSLNFGEHPFVTPPALAREVIAAATKRGAGLEVEAFEVGHVVEAVRWLREGLVPDPLRVNLVFGTPGSIDATPEALDAMIRPLPSRAFWTVTAVGRHQQRMLALAMLRGADGIRVGLEDAVYLRPGELASSNAALVEMAIELASELGRKVAAPEEARWLLGLGRGASPGPQKRRQA